MHLLDWACTIRPRPIGASNGLLCPHARSSLAWCKDIDGGGETGGVGVATVGEDAAWEAAIVAQLHGETRIPRRPLVPLEQALEQQRATIAQVGSNTALRRFLQRHYRPEMACLFAVGDLGDPAAAERVIAAALGDCRPRRSSAAAAAGVEETEDVKTVVLRPTKPAVPADEPITAESRTDHAPDLVEGSSVADAEQEDLWLVSPGPHMPLVIPHTSEHPARLLSRPPVPPTLAMPSSPGARIRPLLSRCPVNPSPSTLA